MIPLNPVGWIKGRNQCFIAKVVSKCLLQVHKNVLKVPNCDISMEKFLLDRSL